jgi:hypothetical protein
MSSAPLEQVPVGVALDVGAQRRPVLPVDQVGDESLELRRVLDAVLRLAEDRTQYPGAPAQPLEDVPLRGLQVVAIGVEQPLPRQVRVSVG